jgi:tRNA(fMet)-specific endonuclease VapC
LTVYLLDTDIVSYLMRAKPPARLIERARRERAELQHTSTITVSEIGFGAYRSGRPAFYIDRFRNLLTELRVVGFDLDAAWRYAEVRSELERRGHGLAEPDLRIASIALARALVLVTHNTKHFKRVPGLLIEDWTI